MHIEFENEKLVFENCYRQFRTIKNNIVHANKAYRPDSPERLNELLDGTQGVVNNVHKNQPSLG